MASFCQGIAAWCEKAEEGLGTRASNVIRDVMKEVARNTPYYGYSVGGYATGHFMANWNVGTSIDSSVTNGIASPYQVFDDIDAVVNPQSVLLGKPFYIVNGTDYAKSVEEGEGWVRTPGYHPIASAVQYAISKYGA